MRTRKQHEPGPAPRGQRWVNRPLRLSANRIAEGLEADNLIKPMAWGQIDTESAALYETSKQKFTRAQQMYFAWDQYLMEVNNGGHDQFLLNSAGVCFADVRGFATAVGDTETVSRLDEVSRRIGGEPAADHDTRATQLIASGVTFDDLDHQVFEGSNQELVNMYVRLHASEFAFVGTIRGLAPIRKFTLRNIATAIGYALAVIIGAIMILDGRGPHSGPDIQPRQLTTKVAPPTD
jgi:hypothetical protein